MNTLLHVVTCSVNVLQQVREATDVELGRCTRDYLGLLCVEHAIDTEALDKIVAHGLARGDVYMTHKQYTWLALLRDL